MGSKISKSLLINLWIGLASLLMAFLTPSSAIAQDFIIEEMDNFGPLGDGFLQEIDLPKRKFTFVREILCEEPADSLCRVFKRDVYVFDIATGTARVLSSTEIPGIEFGDSYPYTENKMLEVHDFFEGREKYNYYIYEIFPLENGLDLAVHYSRDDYGWISLLQFRQSPSLVEKIINYGRSTVYRIFQLWAENDVMYLFLDARTCGASACAGGVDVFRIQSTSY